jgi:predicted regulator of Ras-like GTPase activity (Roadblock/LC7/MglB family)
MKKQTVDGIFKDYSKRPYVEGTMLMSKVGIPIAGNKPRNVPVHSFLSLASVTYEGASELAATTGKEFKEMNIELSNGGRIIIKEIQESYLLAIEVQKYDDKVRDDIESLSDQVSEYISEFDR